MKKSVKTTLGLAILLCGMGMATAQAQSTATTTSTSTSTTTVSADGVTGTDPVPTTPDLTYTILMLLTSFM